MNDLNALNIIRNDTTSLNVEASQSSVIEGIRARYIVARSQPRIWESVSKRILDHCSRPRFAEKARYSLPRWDSRKKEQVEITGFSIRFAEQVLLSMGNVMPEIFIAGDDADKLVVEHVLTDLEANVTFRQQFVVRKLQERRFLRDGQEALGKRTNSTGQTVYLVAVSEQDLRMIVNAQVSLAMRNQVLRLLPADILEDAEDMINSTLDAQCRSESGRTKLVASFSRLGVLTKQLEQFLDKPLEKATADELRMLIRVGTAINEGHTTWDRVMAENKRENVETKTEALKDRLRSETTHSSSDPTESESQYAEPKKRRGRPPKQKLFIEPTTQATEKEDYYKDEPVIEPGADDEF